MVLLFKSFLRFHSSTQIRKKCSNTTKLWTELDQKRIWKLTVSSNYSTNSLVFLDEPCKPKLLSPYHVNSYRPQIIHIVNAHLTAKIRQTWTNIVPKRLVTCRYKTEFSCLVLVFLLDISYSFLRCSMNPFTFFAHDKKSYCSWNKHEFTSGEECVVLEIFSAWDIKAEHLC